MFCLKTRMVDCNNDKKVKKKVKLYLYLLLAVTLMSTRWGPYSSCTSESFLNLLCHGPSIRTSLTAL